MQKLKALIRLARPHHYVKNAFIWLPLFFAHKLNDPRAVVDTLWGFLAFSLAASSVYGINDMKDIDEDREHPTKRNRPLASGAIDWTVAACFIFCLFFLSFWISMTFLPEAFSWILAGYLLLNIGYSLYLKRFAIIDIACVATCLVLRVFAGGISARVPISHWIVIMTFLLSLFLALGKRRDDLLQCAGARECARKSLQGYNMEFVSLGMVVMTSVVIVSYILYCVSPEVIQRHGTSNLYLTGFWVVLGLLRYMQTTFVKGQSGSPVLVLIRDPFLWAVIGGWVLTFYFLLYGTGN